MTKLTDAEKREVINLIQEDRPLPEKYRFLLFDSSPGSECPWGGKSDKGYHTVLPLFTTESFGGNGKSSPGISTQIGDSWSNKLIRGDNRLVLSSLKNGSMRQNIERHGGIKLIYIDPPFFSGIDFSMNVNIGEDYLSRSGNIIQEIAYGDNWKSRDHFIAMMYKRLTLMHDLLADDGCIYVHCDWRVNSYMRLLLDYIFNYYVNEIIWHYTGGGRSANYFSKKHDSIFIYTKSDTFVFNKDNIRIPYKKSSGYAKTGIVSRSGKQYLPNASGTLPDDVWDIPIINPMSAERTGYPTQKPESLLERIIKTSSDEGDIIADFFCGSGTLPAVAERLGRKWIAVDSGRFAIHTTKKRILDIQRRLKEEEKPILPFEILEPGRHGRQYCLGMENSGRMFSKKRCFGDKYTDFRNLILKAYKADRLVNQDFFHGCKNGRMIFIGPPDKPLTRELLESVILECSKRQVRKVDILAFKYQPGILRDKLSADLDIDIIPKIIPMEIFDGNIANISKLTFHEAATIEVIPHYNEGKLAIELANFSIFYSEASPSVMRESFNKNYKGLVVEGGHIMEIHKDSKGLLTRRQLTRNWTDWVDYWSVDYNFGAWQETNKKFENDNHRYGNYTFTSDWQSFRTKRKPSLALISASTPMGAGRHKIAVKIFDIFGNDSLSIIEININDNGEISLVNQS